MLELTQALSIAQFGLDYWCAIWLYPDVGNGDLEMQRFQYSIHQDEGPSLVLDTTTETLSTKSCPMW